MANLIFYYGAMGSSKSANALMMEYNYREKNRKPLLIKTNTDTRDGKYVIKSRIGLEHECILLDEFLEAYHEDKGFVQQYDVIIVDEIQFASQQQIDDLSDIVDFLDISVICYGLRCDFQNKFFPGSKRLMEIANEIHECETICWCGRRALCNTRYNAKGIVRVGNQVELGGNDTYVSLCRKHFKEGKLRK